jgi:hypothetical protein
MAHHRRYRRRRTPDRHRYFVRFETGGVNPPGSPFYTPRQTVTMETPPPGKSTERGPVVTFEVDYVSFKWS